VRPQHATTTRSTQALCSGCVRSRKWPARGGEPSAGTLRSQGLPRDETVSPCLAGKERPKPDNSTADLSRAARRWPKHKGAERSDELKGLARPPYPTLLLAA